MPQTVDCVPLLKLHFCVVHTLAPFSTSDRKRHDHVYLCD